MPSRTKAKGVLPVLKTGDAGFEAAFAKLERRREQESEDVEKDVRRIVQQVREGGDEELLACVRKYDGAKLDQLEVTRKEWEAGVDAVDPADRAALGKAAMRVRDFHR